MKQIQTRLLLDLPDDVTVDVTLIAICIAVGLAALGYLLAV